jgi:hypothetical protein
LERVLLERKLKIGSGVSAHPFPLGARNLEIETWTRTLVQFRPSGAGAAEIVRIYRCSTRADGGSPDIRAAELTVAKLGTRNYVNSVVRIVRRANPDDLNRDRRYDTERVAKPIRPGNSVHMVRIASVLMGMLFLFGTSVQYNDPDPLQWALIYVAAAVQSFVASRRALPWWLPAGTGVIAILWALVIAFRVEASVLRQMFGEFGMASLEIEEAREAFGLVIIGAWMGVLSRSGRWRYGRALQAVGETSSQHHVRPK